MKLVSEVGVGTVAAGVAKGNADEVLISGHDGGTGASPLSSIKYAGAPWEIGLAETQQTLVLNGLRDRVLVQVDGQMQDRARRGDRGPVGGRTIRLRHVGPGGDGLHSDAKMPPRDLARSESPRRKNRFENASPARRSTSSGYLTFIAEEARQIMAELGFRNFDDMIGAVDRLSCQGGPRPLEGQRPRLLGGVRAARRLRRVRRPVRPIAEPTCTKDHLDWRILEADRRLHRDRKSRPRSKSDPQYRSHGRGDLEQSNRQPHTAPPECPTKRSKITCRGAAGQSFGAFLAPGVTLQLVGEANDYLGKGLSGGRILVETPNGSPFLAMNNVIVGNTLLYGATGGEVFINGLAGERFAVRNSGAVAVVEGVGDHGCEYMTGGTVVVIGRTGRNFAAGMSGGVAYVLDEHQLFDTLCNLDMVDLESIWQQEDRDVLTRPDRTRHHRYTGSQQAKRILDKWQEMAGQFVKVMPIDYRKALAKIRRDCENMNKSEASRPRRPRRCSMADPQGFLTYDRVDRGYRPVRGTACKDWREAVDAKLGESDLHPTRRPDAWTAAFRSATAPAARWPTAFPNSTISYTVAIGGRRPQTCIRPTIFPKSPAAYAQRRAKPPVRWLSTTKRLPSNKSNAKLPSGPI